MSVRTFSSADFNRDSGAAKRAAADGPVVITERGVPSHVLMTWSQYQRLSGDRKSIVEALSMPGLDDVEFAPPKLSGAPSPAEFD